MSYYEVVKLSAWAKETGVTYQTAWRWWKSGKLPVPAYQTETGTVIVTPPNPPAEGRVVGYARVSCSDQAAELERQVTRLAMSGRGCAEFVTETGSALNGARPKLHRLLANPSVTTIVVERRDRLVRFGFDYLQSALAAQGRQIVVLDVTEVDEDLVRDVTEVLTSLCARLYGRRGAANRARRALMEAGRDA